MPDRKELIASFEGRVCGGEMHKGGYINVPQKEAKAILELLKEFVNPLLAEHSVFGTNRICSKCKRYLFPAGRYCPHCGRVVKWND